MKKVFFLLFFIFLPLLFFGQKVFIADIDIQGQKKIQKKALLYEISLHQGDSINSNDLIRELERSKRLLFNTLLFQDVQYNITEWTTDQQVKILFTVKNVGIIWLPSGTIELADRNFNVWWEEKKRDPTRLNYIGKLSHRNLTQRIDRLKVQAQIGYSQKAEVDYISPTWTKSNFRNHFNIFYQRAREVQTNTVENKQVFNDSDNKDYWLYRFRSTAGFQYRTNLYLQHLLSATYYNNRIADTVAMINPNFFLQKNNQQYLSFSYLFSSDFRDYRPYPMHGYFWNLGLQYDGLGSPGAPHRLLTYLNYHQYIPLPNKFNLEAITKIQYTPLSIKQPYYNQRALGFNQDFLRGYEYYIIDGQNFAYTKLALRRPLLKTAIQFPLSPIASFKQLPIRVFGKAHSELGYVQDNYYATNNPLANRALYGGGLGLDIIFFTDIIFQTEYSINHLKESGFFLHTKVLF